MATQLPVVLEQRRPMTSFRFSPSAVATFQLCPLRWAFSTMGGLRAPDSEAGAFGTRAHLLRENYAKYGTVPDGNTYEERCARTGLRDLPPPGVGHVEMKVEFNTEYGLGRGKVDWFVEDAGAVGYDPQGIGTHGIPLVIDHKFKKSVDVMQTSEQLRDDPQVAYYGAGALARVPHAPVVDFLWANVEKKKTPRSVPRFLRLHAEEVCEAWDRMMVHVRMMSTLFASRDTVSITDVPRDARSCYAFNRPCDFQQLCPVTQRERVVASMQTLTSLEDKIMSNQQGFAPAQQQGFPTSLPPNGQAPQQGFAPVLQQFQQPYDQAAQQFAQQQQFAPPQQQQFAPPQQQQFAQPPAQQQFAPQQPQFAPPQMQQQPQGFAQPPVAAQPPQNIPQNGHGSAVLPPDAPQGAAPTVIEAEFAETKAKRGRPSKKEGDQDRRGRFAIQLLDGILTSGRAEGDAAVAFAVEYADKLIARLDG